MCHNGCKRKQIRSASKPLDLVGPYFSASHQPLIAPHNQSVKLVQSQPPSYQEIENYTSPIDPSPRTSTDSTLIPISIPTQTVNQSITTGNQVQYRSIKTGTEIMCTNPLGHSPKTEYGTIGIIAGIVFFPWGLFWTKCDSQTICTSCQVILKHKGCKCHDRQQNSKIMREDLHQSMSNRRSSSRRIKGGCASKRRC